MLVLKAASSRIAGRFMLRALGIASRLGARAASPASPVELRGWSHQPSRGRHVELGCIARCSPSSTEACRRNPDQIPDAALLGQGPVIQSNPDILSDGRRMRAMRTNPGPRQGRVVRSRCGGRGPPNPVQGIRAHGVRLTWLAWGALSQATGQSGRTSPGTAGKSGGCEELNHERPVRACQ